MLLDTNFDDVAQFTIKHFNKNKTIEKPELVSSFSQKYLENVKETLDDHCIMSRRSLSLS